MQNKTDAELLRDYAANRSEAAFGEIVRRYADAVYSAALRQMGNEEQARDVAQTVFVDLARKAGSLNANTLLIGWLHRGARLAALEQLRTDQRRQHRERQAMELLDPFPEVPNDGNAVRPVLDEAIANLGTEDRDALLLRFFKNESLASIGTALGVSEDAAQKRVSRALGKLRDFLEQRGIKTTATALSAALAANAVQSAPAGFAASLVTGALAKAMIAGSSSTPYLFTFANMKTAVLILALAGSLAGLTAVKIKSQHELRDVQALAQRQVEKLASLRAENERLANLTNELARVRREATDVLRLRAEVTRLRRDAANQKLLLMANSSAAQTNQTPEPTLPIINIRAKCISVPEELPSGLAGILAEPLFKTTVEALKGREGVAEISDMQVTTLAGRQAQAQALSKVIVNGAEVTIGPTLDFIANASTNSDVIELNIAASVHLLLGTSPAGAGGMPTVEVLTMTNSASLWDGQTLEMRVPMSSNARLSDKPQETNTDARKTLLIFVTPTLIDPAGNRLYPEAATTDPQGEERIYNFCPPVAPFVCVNASRPREKFPFVNSIRFTDHPH